MAAAILTLLILQRNTRRLSASLEDQRSNFGGNRDNETQKRREKEKEKEKERERKRREKEKEREMKMTWKKKKNTGHKKLAVPNLPFETQQDDDESNKDSNFQLPSSDKDEQNETLDDNKPSDDVTLADGFLQQGNKLAEDGKYREALGKWEAAITLMPEKAVLHEQKAQVLLEIGDAWGALKAATRASELDPSWAEAWTTLGRAQLNFGEPDNAIESFDRALAIKAELPEARADRQTAMQLVKKRKQLHTTGVCVDRSRYVVGDGSESNLES